MKYITILFVALMSLAAAAVPGGPGWPGGPGGPGGGGPGPGFPVPGGNTDPCDADYNGNYQIAGPVYIALRSRGRGWVDVTLSTQGQTYFTQGTCDARGVAFNFGGDYYHQANFVYKHFGPFKVLQGLVGEEYIHNRPYQKFSADLR